MAEIRTAIQVVDGFSPALKSMNNALGIVMGSLADTQKQLGKPIDTSSVAAAQRELAQAALAIDKIGKKAEGASKGQDKLNVSMEKSSNVIQGLTGKIRGLVAAYASYETIKNTIGAADTYANTTSRLELMLDPKTSVKELESMIRASADRTLSSFKDTADAVGKMGIQAGDAFSSNLEVVQFVEQLNKHMKIAGTDTAAAAGAMMQMTQAMSNGVLRGEELNSVLDGMPTVAKTIGQYFKDAGYNLPLKDIAEKGLITSEIVKDALFRAADETNKKFNSMKTTFSDLWQLFKNRADESLKPVYDRLTEISNNPALKNFVILAGEAVGKIANYVISAVGKIQTVFTFVKNNMDLIAPILGGIAAGFMAMGAAIAFAKLQALYHTAASIAQTVALVAMEFASGGAAAGFTALAAAMSVNPVMLFIYAVIALIGVFYLAVAVVNKFAGTSISATGAITGAFAALGSFIYNQFMYLWNTIISFAEFLINVFQNPIYSIKALFVNLAVNFIDSCISMTKGWDKFATGLANAFLDAINWVIKGWNKLIDLLPNDVASTLGLGKATEFTARTSITSDLSDAKADLLKSLGEKPEDYVSIPKAQYMDVGKNATSAYKWGKGGEDKVTNKITDLFSSVSKLTDDPKAQEDAAKVQQGKITNDEFKKRYPEIAKQLDKLVGNTNGLKDNSEDLELMRAIGEREAINRFTTAEIKVNMTNNNSVSSKMDIDSVFSQFEEKLRDVLVTTANGVHV